MKSRSLRVLRIVGAVLLCLPGLDQLVTFTRIVASRLTYPMDVEWMEGGVLYMAYRLGHGDPVYPAIGRGYIPFPYAPVHFAVLAAVGKIVGLDYWSGRLVSLLAFATVMGLLLLAVDKQWRSSSFRVPVLVLAAGWIVAGYPAAGTCYDLIRVDTLAIVFVTLAAAFLARGPLRWRGTIFVALLLTAAIYTKQSMALFVAWVCLFALVRDRWRALWLPLVTGVLCLATLAALQSVSDGQFWFYTVTMLSKHYFMPANFREAVETLSRFAPFVLLVPVAYWYARRRSGWDPEVFLWAGMLACGIVTSIVGYSKATAWLNNLAYGLVYEGAIALLVLGATLRSTPLGPVRFRTELVALVAIALVLATRHYDGARFAVDAQRLNKARALNAYIKNLDGSVIDPGSPYLPIRNGHAAPQFHPMPYQDAKGAGFETPGLFEYLRAGHAKYLITGSCLDWPEYVLFLGRDFDRLYAFEAHLPAFVEDYSLPTGFDCVPEDLFRLREDVNAPLHTVFEKPTPSGEVSEPLQADAITVGGTYPPLSGHACALSNGRVICWGSNDWGQASPILPSDVVMRPRVVMEGATHISAGGRHTCALRDDKVTCWGDNRDGELGDGTNAFRDRFVEVVTPRHLVDVTAGAAHTCGIDDTRGVVCWGANRSGQIGVGQVNAWMPPTPVVGVVRTVQLALGRDHTCARDEVGVVRCWGNIPAVGLRLEPEPLALPKASAVSVSADETCAILAAGRIACFGSNEHGDLANGNGKPRRSPGVIRGLTATDLAMGRGHACAISSNQLFCWGANRWRESAIAEQDSDVLPSPLAVPNPKAIALGPEFACAIDQYGLVECWGRNDRSQLGNDFLRLYDARGPEPVRWYPSESATPPQ